jgi:uncharacterized protein (DUF2252 family)
MLSVRDRRTIVTIAEWLHEMRGPPMTMTATAAPPRRRSHRHPTAVERAAAGRAARAIAPRASLGAWDPPADREPVIATLQRQAETRVPELVPIRYGRMVVSPFTFYRGAAAIMAADLAAAPRTGLEVQLCGDAHLSNFGAFAAPDRRLVFSINDFDETLRGPFEWDVKRLVTSFAVAGRQLGISAQKRRSIVMAAAAEYRRAMRAFAGMSSLEVWYTRLDVDDIARQFGVKARAKQTIRRDAAKAASKDSLKALAKLTRVVDGTPAFISDPPVLSRPEDLAGPEEAARFRAAAETLVRSYKATLPNDRRVLLDRYGLVDVARKVVGVGSVGTRAWVALLLGRDGDDPLMLQIKEAQASVLEPYLGASPYKHHGQRVVEGQRLMQASSDILLGWVRAEGFDGVSRDFFVRQLWDRKVAADVETMRSQGLTIYANLCGWTLARAHARSGDLVAIASYVGGSDTFDGALADFAEAYADQNERDHATLQQAIADGTIAATLGV